MNSAGPVPRSLTSAFENAVAPTYHFVSDFAQQDAAIERIRTGIQRRIFRDQDVDITIRLAQIQIVVYGDTGIEYYAVANINPVTGAIDIAFQHPDGWRSVAWPAEARDKLMEIIKNAEVIMGPRGLMGGRRRRRQTKRRARRSRRRI